MSTGETQSVKELTSDLDIIGLGPPVAKLRRITRYVLLANSLNNLDLLSWL